MPATNISSHSSPLRFAVVARAEPAAELTAALLVELLKQIDQAEAPRRLAPASSCAAG